MNAAEEMIPEMTVEVAEGNSAISEASERSPAEKGAKRIQTIRKIKKRRINPKTKRKKKLSQRQLLQLEMFVMAQGFIRDFNGI